MKKYAIAGLLILALGAGCESASHKRKAAKPSAAGKLAAATVPVSGGSTVSSSRTVSGGTARGGTVNKIQTTKRHRAPRRHIKKS